MELVQLYETINRLIAKWPEAKFGEVRELVVGEPENYIGEYIRRAARTQQLPDGYAVVWVGPIVWRDDAHYPGGRVCYCRTLALPMSIWDGLVPDGT